MNIEMITLVKLQKLDEKLAGLMRIEQEGPIKKAVVEVELETASLKLEELLEQEQALKKRKRELDSEVTDTDEKIKTNQGRQLQAKNNEEYRAMLKEADYLRKSNSAREDELLEILEKLESLEKDNVRLKEELEALKLETARKLQEIDDWLTEGLKDKAGLERERHLLVGDLPAATVRQYTRIYQHRNGRAVVGIVDGVCQMCYLQIPPQSYNELQRNIEMMTCPNCNRIIYWADHEDFIDVR